MSPTSQQSGTSGSASVLQRTHSQVDCPRAPYLVVITDRGNSLRFYRPYQLHLRDHALREFLLNEGWKKTPAWKSRYAPGGDRYTHFAMWCSFVSDAFSSEWIMHVFATYIRKLYDITILVPRWILFIITGGIGSILINFLHRPSKKRPVSKPAVSDALVSTTKSISGPMTVTSPAVKAMSEPKDKPSASSTATVNPPRTPRKGKGKR